MRIIGIHDGHNAAACLLEDGRIVAAVQEERFSRVKNHDVFPARSVAWLLEQAGCEMEGIDAVAMNGFHMPIHRDRKKLIEATRWGGSLEPGRLARRLARKIPMINEKWREKRRNEREAEAIASGIPHRKLHYIEHHRCHAEAAYWGSPWRDEKVLVMTADGAGDDLCATVNLVNEQGRMDRIATVHESHSPALVYLTITTLLGMVPNEHEYKLMGMAPYAPEAGAQEVAKIFDDMFMWDPRQPMAWKRRPGVPSAYYLYDTLKRKLDLKRFDLVCGGVQLWTEQLLAEWVRRCVKQTGVRKVALSGGIFMNVKANQVIAELEEVEDLFIFPSCGDETNSMGAAWGHYRDIGGAEAVKAIEPIKAIYWGPEHATDEMRSALESAGDEFIWTEPASIAEQAAGFLAKGDVVARFDGRAEFGARALGNRSILGNPSEPKVVKMINEMIKSRDFWMPFACSMLAERVDDYSVNPKGLRMPYMILTTDATERVGEIEAGTHPYDHTVRPQVVEADWNPGYHALIKAFEAHTGVGALLNTSFNLHGFPIVNSPAEALDVMRKSGLKYLILGPFWVEKKDAV